MEQFELIAEKREDVGKGASRRLRRDGKVPGIVYGTDKDAAMISLNHDEIMHHLEHEVFYSHILTLNVGKTKEKVVLKDLQRHPFKHTLLHIDLLRIKEDEELNMRVPLHFINEEKCVGVKTGGGVISHLMSELEIVCLPKDLPEYIEVDMLEVNIGDTVVFADIKLPQGVQIFDLLHGGDKDQVIASVHMPRVAAEEEEGAQAEEGVVAAAEVKVPEENEG